MKRPKSQCRTCGLAIDKPGYCDKHKREAYKMIISDRDRPTSAQRGYGSKWQKARAAFLRDNPLCIECKRSGRLTAATVVDHIVPHRGDMARFWDTGNWQALCKRHHDQKTMRELSGALQYEGGFTE